MKSQSPKTTLDSTIAGTWYPKTEQGIRSLAEKWEATAARGETPPAGPPNVLILPHAGWEYSGETAWAAIRAIRGAPFRRVVVLAPSQYININFNFQIL